MSDKSIKADKIENVDKSDVDVDENENKSKKSQTELYLYELRDAMIDYKKIWYPDNVICKFYKEDAPGKRDFNEWITKMNKLIKKTEKHFKSKKPKEDKIKPSYIVKELSDFMKCDKINSNTLITSYMHNYFVLNDLYNKKCREYVIPDSKLKKLFWNTLLDKEIIDENGDFLERDDIIGFKHIELQTLLSPCYEFAKKTNNEEKPKRKKPSKLSSETKLSLEKQKEVQNTIHGCRKEIKKIYETIKKLEKNQVLSEKYGDSKEFDKKIDEVNETVNIKKSELRLFCDEHNFPYSKKYFA